MAGGVHGLDDVLGNLNREIEGIKERGGDGCLKAARYVEGEAKKRVPVDSGNLRASGYSRREQAGKDAAEVGFSASYAVFVHENMEQKLKGQPRRSGSGKGRYWETGQPKFLQSVLEEDRDTILDIIREEAEVE